MKSFRQLLAVLLLASSTAAPALAADYPERPITIVVPYPAGGSADILARTVGHRHRRALRRGSQARWLHAAARNGELPSH